MTAVYVISSHDNISVFRDKRKTAVRQSGPLTACISSDGVPLSVAVIGIDSKDFDFALRDVNDDSKKVKALDQFRKKTSESLKSLGIPCGEMRVFVHFGGQDSDAVVARNKMLGRLCGDDDSFKCYAISFGETTPEEIFPSGRFLPPPDEDFDRLCKKLHSGKIEDYCHLRALRLFLPMFDRNDEDRFVMDELDDVLCSVYDGNRLGWALSDGEKTWLAGNQRLKGIFDMADKDDWCRTPDELSADDYKFLLSNLLTKGDSK